jgi:hypothetical protein
MIEIYQSGLNISAQIYQKYHGLIPYGVDSGTYMQFLLLEEHWSCLVLYAKAGKGRAKLSLRLQRCILDSMGVSDHVKILERLPN